MQDVESRDPSKRVPLRITLRRVSSGDEVADANELDALRRGGKVSESTAAGALVRVP